MGKLSNIRAILTEVARFKKSKKDKLSNFSTFRVFLIYVILINKNLVVLLQN